MRPKVVQPIVAIDFSTVALIEALRQLKAIGGEPPYKMIVSSEYAPAAVFEILAEVEGGFLCDFNSLMPSYSWIIFDVKDNMFYSEGI